MVRASYRDDIGTVHGQVEARAVCL